ncbi:MAG TPA: serine/threonine-protein kinase [Polyangiaceae bacterium]|jgi:serine/threonine-protein kinase|nr:serine/threonine-protein kinase [Polyangiaceae bacterium]
MASERDESKHAAVSGLRATFPVTATDGSSDESAPVSSGSRYGKGDVVAGKYRLGNRLGEGGMGDVWLAHNETLDIDVALKLIRGELASPEMTERLLHEARAAARLGHPAIVRVNDFGKTERGDPFIVMELLEGEDLAAALASRGRLNPIAAVRTLLPIAHALMVAHNKGIVHRDIKPENVFLAKSDEGKLQPKLVDFGVAKLERVKEDLTQSREVVGSPLYMSPEQARGDEVDHRADIWAFAVLLYETITGRAPFQGKNYDALLYSIVANPPIPTVDLGGGDADLWAILERGFRKEADQRWFSMRDFGEALAHWLEDRDVHDDITGASLTATWLSWKKDDQELHPAWGEDGSRGSQLPGALPPLPDLAPEMRARVDTIRKARAAPARGLVTAAIALFALALIGIVLVTRTSPPRAEAAAAPSASALPVTAAAAAVANPTAALQEVEHERAVEAVLASASASPVPASGRPAEHVHAHIGKTDTLSHGIHVTDPYSVSASVHHATASKLH